MPFHDGEIELMKTLRSFYKTGTSNNEWMTIGQDLLDSFLNFKVVCIPRAFLNFREPLDLKMRLVNQDDFFNKKTNEIVQNLFFLKFNCIDYKCVFELCDGCQGSHTQFAKKHEKGKAIFAS